MAKSFDINKFITEQKRERKLGLVNEISQEGPYRVFVCTQDKGDLEDVVELFTFDGSLAELENKLDLDHSGEKTDEFTGVGDEVKGEDVYVYNLNEDKLAFIVDGNHPIFTIRDRESVFTKVWGYLNKVFNKL